MHRGLGLRVHRSGKVVTARLEEMAFADPGDGEVLIRAHYSGINYKDALAVTGAAPILKRHPMVAGIDVAGRVVASGAADLSPGTPVLVVGGGLGEERDGGFAEYVLCPAAWVVPLPAGLDLRQAMILGTAGFTAALAIQRLQDNGLRTGQGPVVVTGASGGVGCLAVAMLAGLGHRVVAVSGKPRAEGFLRGLGAAEILDRRSLETGGRPLERARWAAAVDNLGGAYLDWLCRTLKPLGGVASIGLASDSELHTSVMPFILRGVSLLGVNSTYCPAVWRQRLWGRLAGDLRPADLDRICSREVGLAELVAAMPAYLAGEALGRTLVRIAAA